MQGINENIPVYIFPDNIMPSSNNVLTIHEEFGTLNWNSPQLSGKYTIAIMIKEYRAGQLMSETIRDFQFNVGDFISNPPSIQVPFNEVTLSVGDTFDYEIDVNQAEGIPISVRSLGLPFLILDPAQFSLDTNYLAPPVSGNFSWTITDNHVLLEPYYVVFRIENEETSNSDCGQTSYEVLKININDSPTNIVEVKNSDFKIFPNPMIQQQLNIELPKHMIPKQCSYKIINQQGEIVEIGTFNSNPIQQIDIQKLRVGNYFFILKNENEVSVKKFFKVK